MRLSSFIPLSIKFFVLWCAAADNSPSRARETKSEQILSSHLVEPRSRNPSVAENVVWPVIRTLWRKRAISRSRPPNIPVDFHTQITKEVWLLWLVDITDPQVDSIKGNEGVVDVTLNVVEAGDFAAVPIPTEPGQLSEAKKVKRDIHYNT